MSSIMIFIYALFTLLKYVVGFKNVKNLRLIWILRSIIYLMFCLICIYNLDFKGTKKVRSFWRILNITFIWSPGSEQGYVGYQKDNVRQLEQHFSKSLCAMSRFSWDWCIAVIWSHTGTHICVDKKRQCWW